MGFVRETSVIAPVAAMNKSKSGSHSRLNPRKIWRSRSKSQSRSSGVLCLWTPQGGGRWTSAGGRQVTLTDASLLSLTEAEMGAMHQVALIKLQSMDLGCNVVAPKVNDNLVTDAKPKRRTILLRKRAVTTGTLEQCKDGGEPRPQSGLVFGIPLSKCIANDRIARRAACSDPIAGSNISIASVNASACRLKGSSQSAEDVSIPDKQLLIKSKSFTGSQTSCNIPLEGSMFKKHSSGTSFTSLHMDRKSSSMVGLSMLGSSHDSCGSGPASPDWSMTSPHGEVLTAHIPHIVSSCFLHLETYGLNRLGIFRVSSSKKRVRQLREDFDSGKFIQLGEEHCPHDVATLLKEYFRDLPEPLLTRDLYPAFVGTQRIRNRRQQFEALRYLVQLLPIANRDTLWALFKFLSKVALHANDHRNEAGEWVEGNKMDSNNLATLFGPNILHTAKSGLSSERTYQVESTKRAEERIDVIKVVRAMIDNFGDLFDVPAEELDECYRVLLDQKPEVLMLLLQSKLPPSDFDIDPDTGSSVCEGSDSASLSHFPLDVSVEVGGPLVITVASEGVVGSSFHRSPSKAESITSDHSTRNSPSPSGDAPTTKLERRKSGSSTKEIIGLYKSASAAVVPQSLKSSHEKDLEKRHKSSSTESLTALKESFSARFFKKKEKSSSTSAKSSEFKIQSESTTKNDSKRTRRRERSGGSQEGAGEAAGSTSRWFRRRDRPASTSSSKSDAAAGATSTDTSSETELQRSGGSTKRKGDRPASVSSITSLLRKEGALGAALVGSFGPAVAGVGVAVSETDPTSTDITTERKPTASAGYAVKTSSSLSSVPSLAAEKRSLARPLIFGGDILAPTVPVRDERQVAVVDIRKEHLHVTHETVTERDAVISASLTLKVPLSRSQTGPSLAFGLGRDKDIPFIEDVQTPDQQTELPKPELLPHPSHSPAPPPRQRYGERRHRSTPFFANEGQEVRVDGAGEAHQSRTAHSSAVAHKSNTSTLKKQSSPTNQTGAPGTTTPATLQASVRVQPKAVRRRRDSSLNTQGTISSTDEPSSTVPSNVDHHSTDKPAVGPQKASLKKLSLTPTTQPKPALQRKGSGSIRRGSAGPQSSETIDAIAAPTSVPGTPNPPVVRRRQRPQHKTSDSSQQSNSESTATEGTDSTANSESSSRPASGNRQSWPHGETWKRWEIISSEHTEQETVV